ncbi:MAG: hypothetical protein NTV09_03610, partial [Bacteroidetes bacterium]|nr:hypothetical protein [Bacteroidota bacterium]
AATSSFFRNVTMSTATDFISGTANTFNKVIMPGTTCSIGGDGNTFDTLICNNPGQAISIYNNVTVIVNSLLQADGNCNGLTSITSGGTAVISKPAGTVTLNYVLLQGITGAGGATFIANNSVNGGNVTGITINAPAPQNLFWVGGTGNWNDVNHWSTSSGGAGGSCVPSQFDNIFFDANSFPSAGDSVKINVPTIYCNTMDWSAANTPVLYSTSNIRLNLYGSLILNSSLIWAVLGDIYLLSPTAGNIINTYGVVLQGQGSGTNLRFSGSGSWSLQSGISLGNSGSMRFDSGTFLSNGLPVICNDFYINASAATTVMLDTSTINCGGSWNVSNTFLLTLDADSTFITSNSFSGGVGRIYRDVVCGTIDDCCYFKLFQECYHVDCNRFHLRNRQYF